jgi:hypothetical protein
VGLPITLALEDPYIDLEGSTSPQICINLLDNIPLLIDRRPLPGLNKVVI